MKRRHGATMAGLGLAALALASCSARRPAQRPAVAAAPRPVPPPLAPAASPANYVATAASIDLFVVRASEMALARPIDPHVALIAARLRDEHRGLASQLSFAGRRIDVLPAAALAPRDQRRLARLAEPASSDSEYLVEMHAAHDRSLALHALFAARGASATLRPVAANGMRAERAHLVLLGRGRA